MFAKYIHLRWNELRSLLEICRETLSSAKGLQEFRLECDETEEWMREKARLLASTGEGPLNECDLESVVSLQRKLSSMERDLAAIQVQDRL